MNRPDERISEPNPEKTRQPAPTNRNRRSDNGGRPGDGGKVVPEEHFLSCRHKINPVVEFLGRGLVAVRHLQDILFDFLAVCKIKQEVECKPYENDKRCHGFSPFKP